MKMQLFKLITGGVFAAILSSASVYSSPAYPTKPIRLIAASPPGSPPDLLARIVAEPLGAALGQPVLVDNRPGASGTIGMGAVAKATPDGHTLGIINLTQIVAPSLLPQMPYDTVRNLAPVTQISWTANILVLSANSPIQSIGDFLALAKANPNQLTYASAGNGTPSHLASELFKHHEGIDLLHIPFKGIGQGLSALLGAQVDIAFAGVATAAPFIRSGKLRALGTAAPRHLLGFPDLRTIAEQGFPGYELNEWQGIAAPPGTSPEVITKLAMELARIITSTETKARLAAIGFYPADNFGPDALQALIRAELPRWKKIVREAGVRAD